MPVPLGTIRYCDLNSRQRENYNFLKISALLADYGFMTMRLNDDWQGADFIAQHIDGETFLKVQLKGRLDFQQKYRHKNIHMAFRSEAGDWYLYPHDELLAKVLPDIEGTDSWALRGGYSYPGVSVKMLDLLKPYRIGRVNETIPTPTCQTNGAMTAQ
ncbi:MAG TPA: hypothetical protein VIM11_07020 [Tepidisphaeraceae bacterium]|jgi:hypothetical protein